METFKAFQVTKDPTFQAKIIEQEPIELADNEVLVEVAYSDVNYKDALASSESGNVIRTYPMTPGIDLAGTVIKSSTEQFSPGEKVLVTGYGLGVTHPGGYSQYQAVPSEWLVKLPERLSTRQAMILGTAGFTAALAVNALLEQGMKPTNHVLVTGASGGVGSVAIALLHKLGFTTITAFSRKTTAESWLTKLGATQVIQPTTFLPEKTKPLAKQTVDYVIDTVGGAQLSQLLPLISYNGAAALCGNASGIELNTTVLPFILRNIQLIGIDSVNVPHEQREKIWQSLAELAITDDLLVTEISLTQLPETIAQLLAGTHQGRTLVHVGEKE
ncbi:MULTISPECIES: acryloyl-CoA reductase [Enterococcus]|uniref:Alcohol dehydrogenase n=1 Tax=Enterococcus thailandicus TaxID=417368 RepID=A0A1L8XP17_ENTTH|nr:MULTISPECIES: acryloyl-CoA reductase [Enterococcus]ASZ06856.1 NADPH:quinone reductase [Enterococcus thailandicus]MDA3964300.1 acryloyl-CoA reductase [Enterococcus thailandicus]MDT2750980.1 acryloyl-CoA reductase [Enterococcus thailandicus]MDT2775693.1 acryloyl-CoA reductase [Enterococcus thailandicus]MDT2794555.1 acryloyl-CoA reductase [Enterococcus thailandicus]